MRQGNCPPHPEELDYYFASYGVKTTTRRSATEPRIFAVVNKIAQAVIVEAEPHPPQVPQLRLRKAVAITSPAMAFTGRTPASGRSGEERSRLRRGFGHRPHELIPVVSKPALQRSVVRAFHCCCTSYGVKATA